MIDIDVWCQYHMGTVQGFLVKSLRMPVVPRVGERIELWDGWSGLEVLTIAYQPYAAKVILEIRPDHTGEIRAKVEREKNGECD